MIIFNDDKRKAIGPTKNISYYIEDRTLMTDIHSAFARIKLMKFGVAAEQIMCMWLKKDKILTVNVFCTQNATKSVILTFYNLCF